MPVEYALAHSTGPIVVRVTTADDVAAVARLDRGRLVSIEVPPDLAGLDWPDGVPLDVVLDNPARQAAGLYSLNPVARQRPVRVTVPGRPGLARAARVAMALQFPVRLLALQPSPEVLADLEEVLEVYLHGPQTSAPVEFFQSALAWLLRGDAPPAWIALELDPDWFPRAGDDIAENDRRTGKETDTPIVWPPAQPGFVQARLAGLVDAGGECGDCPFREWCQGLFKWPDAAYDCGGVKRLLARVAESAAQLARDIDEAGAVTRGDSPLPK